MLSYLSIGHRYRPPSSLSIRQHFTFATACSTAERILLKFVLNSRCQSSSSVPPTRLNGAIAMPSTPIYPRSAARAGVKVGFSALDRVLRSGFVCRSESEDGEGLEPGAVPGEVAAGGGVVGVPGAVEDAGDGVGDGGEQPGGLPGAQPGCVFAEGCVAPVVKAVFDGPVVAIAGEQERGAGLGGGEGGDGQDGLGLQFCTAGGGAGKRVVVAGVTVAAGGGCSAMGEPVPVPLDEHELGGAGQLRGDRCRDFAGDLDGADLMPAVAGLAAAVQHRLVLPPVRVGGGVQPGLVVLEDEHPADAERVHRRDVGFLGMHRVGCHDDQFASFSFSFSFSFSLFLAAACARVVPVAVTGIAAAAGVVAGAGAAVEDGLQEGDEAGDLVGFHVDAVLAEDGAGGDV